MKENHGIDWDSAKIVERERDDQARGVKEAVDIRILPNSVEKSHILWSFDPMSYLGANYLMVQLTVE